MEFDESASILSLPSDCALLVIEMLTDIDLLALAQTCRDLNRLVESDDIWLRRLNNVLHGGASSELKAALLIVRPKLLYLGLVREHGHMLFKPTMQCLDAPYGALVVSRLDIDDGTGLPCIDLISVIVHKLMGAVQGRRVFRIPLSFPGDNQAPEEGTSSSTMSSTTLRSLSWLPRNLLSTISKLSSLSLTSLSSDAGDQKREMRQCMCLHHPECNGPSPRPHPSDIKSIQVEGKTIITARCIKKECRHVDLEPMLRFTGYVSLDMKGVSPLVDLPCYSTDSFDSLGLEVEVPDEMVQRAHFRHVSHFLRLLSMNPNERKPHASLPDSLVSDQKTMHYEVLELEGGHPLAGLWRGTYSSHGLEIINFGLRDRTGLPWPLRPSEGNDAAQPDSQVLVGQKITGDSNVPAGQISIIADPSSSRLTTFRRGCQFNLDPDYSCVIAARESLSKLTVASSFEARGHIAAPNFDYDSWSSAELVLFSESSDVMGLVWHQLRSFSLFSRLHLKL